MLALPTLSSHICVMNACITTARYRNASKGNLLTWRRAVKHQHQCNLSRFPPAAIRTPCRWATTTAPLPPRGMTAVSSSGSDRTGTSSSSSSRRNGNAEALAQKSLPSSVFLSSSSLSFSSSSMAPSNDLAVTRLSVRRNAAADSPWETVPNWCELCAEPVNSWHNHFGKREHICLEMTLNAMLQHPRCWHADAVWTRAELFREHYVRRPRGQPRSPSASVRRLLEAGMVVPGVDHPLNIFYEVFDKAGPLQRREELFGLLRHLKEAGLLSLSPATFNAASDAGQAALYQEVMPMVACIFPNSEVRMCSAMFAEVTSTLNLESVFQVCCLAELVPPEMMTRHISKHSTSPPPPPRLPHAKGQGSGDSAELSGQRDGAFAEDADDVDAAEGLDDDPIPPHIRSGFPRVILGSLRWSLMPDAVPPPPALNRQDAKYDYYYTVAARAARLLLSELVHCRVSELVSRLEPLLQSDTGRQLLRHRGAGLPTAVVAGKDAQGCAAERIAPALQREIFTQRLPPFLSNHGALQFTGGVGLCASHVLGTVSAEQAIARREASRAARQKSRKTSLQRSASLKPVSRSVRVL